MIKQPVTYLENQAMRIDKPKTGHYPACGHHVAVGKCPAVGVVLVKPLQGVLQNKKHDSF